MGHERLIGLEFIVERLDDAVGLWSDLLGFELVERRSADTIAGELAVVTDGRVAITLLEPADAGPGTVLPDRTPRLSQVILDTPDPGSLARTTSEAGLAVTPTGAGFFVTPESVGGALGSEFAIVAVVVDG